MVQVNRKLVVSLRNSAKASQLARTLSITFHVENILRCCLSIVFLCGLNLSLQGSERTNEWANFGFLFDRVPTVFRQGERTEILGPFFSWEKARNGSLFTFSPLFSLYRDSSIPQTEAELGYPILSFDKFGIPGRCHGSSPGRGAMADFRMTGGKELPPAGSPHVQTLQIL